VAPLDVAAPSPAIYERVSPEAALLGDTAPNAELPNQGQRVSPEAALLGDTAPNAELPNQGQRVSPEAVLLGDTAPDVAKLEPGQRAPLEAVLLGNTAPNAELPNQGQRVSPEAVLLGDTAPDVAKLEPGQRAPLEAALLGETAPDVAKLEPGQRVSPEAALLGETAPDVAKLEPGQRAPLEAALLGETTLDVARLEQGQHVPPDRPAASEPAAERSVPASEASPAAPPATAQQGSAPQQRTSRRARFEEIGTRTASPTVAQPVAPPTPPKPSPASQIFNRSQPERDIMDWGRLLFDSASQPAQPEAPAPTSPAAQQPADTEPSLNPAMADHSTVAQATRAAQATQQPKALRSRPEQPVQLAESTRRFLRPLVGVDPESVRIYRGELADQVTREQAADAATAGDAILLAPGNHDETAPQTLGLLAHELTHVARQRTRRFVPPIVRGRVGETADEEVIARAVESQARSAAHAADPVSRASQNLGEAPHSDLAGSTPGRLPSQQPASPAQDPGGVWSGLPAPWQPLPGWVTSAWGESAGLDQAAGHNSTATSASQSAASNAAADAATPAFQLAEQDRSIENSAPAAPASAAPAAAPAPMDMDALAKQVYAALKQRLAAERRRLG
jgi:hypothetical protein